MIIQWITKLFILIVAILLVAYYLPNVSVDGFYTALIVALLLGVLNMTIRPILLLLTLPINLITLGLFTFVINGALLLFIASFVQGFEIAGFWTSVLAALIISVVTWALTGLLLQKGDGDE